jgi:hypothetical protein
LGSVDFIGDFYNRQIPLSPQQNPKRMFWVFLLLYFPNYNIIDYFCGDIDVVLPQKCGDTLLTKSNPIIKSSAH